MDAAGNGDQPVNKKSCQYPLGVGRLLVHWRGRYNEVRNPGEKSVGKAELKYFIIQSKEADEDKSINTYLMMVPVTWISADKKYYLYPPENKEKEGFGPANWASRVFQSNRDPVTNWLEFDIDAVVLVKPRIYLGALRALKALERGVDPTNITDSDAPRPRRRKRNDKDENPNEIPAQKQNRQTQKNNPSKDPVAVTPPTTAVQLTSQIREEEAPTSVENSNVATNIQPSPAKQATSQTAHPAHPAQPSNVKKGKKLKDNNKVPPKSPSKVPSVFPAGTQPTPAKQSTSQTYDHDSQPSVEHPNVMKPTTVQGSFKVQSITDLPAGTQPTPAKQSASTTYDHDARSSIEDSNLNGPIEPMTGHGGTSNNAVDQNLTGRLQDGFGAQTPTPHQGQLILDTGNWNSATPPTNSDLLDLENIRKSTVPNQGRQTTEGSPFRRALFPPEHGCNNCAFMEKRLVNIEKKLEDMSSTYQRDMQSLMSSLEKVKSAVAGSGNPLKYTSQSAPALMTHHEKTVAGALKTITCDSVEKLSAMDTVLQNDNIACSLIAVLLHNFATSNSIHILVHNLFSHLINDETSESLQWKAGARGADKRQGLSIFFSVVAVIGVATSYYLESRNQPKLCENELFELIKNSRRAAASRYREAAGITTEQADELAKFATPVKSPDQKLTKKILQSNVQLRMRTLEKVVNNFKIQP